MTEAWALAYAYPALARMPTRLPWRLAHWMGRGRAAEREHLLSWLSARFGQVLPQSDQEQRMRWARAHLAMLARERMDAMAFDRLGQRGGPDVQLAGAEHVRSAQVRGKGFILVLNHFDRLLTTPVVLARQGISTHVLTMPVLDNPEVDGAHRRFLLRKISRYTAVTGGGWHSTDEGMRPVLESLRRGEGWVILADAWRAEFGRLREHSFLGGYLSLPTGIERLARSSGAALLHGITYSHSATSLRVVVEPLVSDPQQAIDTVVARLEQDVRERPWAWWHWGLWEHMWSPVRRGSFD